MNILNESLRLIRVFHHINQTNLANDFNISKSYLSEIESGKKTVSIELLNKYSERFNIPVSSLMLFSESLGPDGTSKKARSFVTNKVIKMLNWISEIEEVGIDAKKTSR